MQTSCPGSRDLNWTGKGLNGDDVCKMERRLNVMVAVSLLLFIL
jgi:hypothetical protein